LKWLAGYQASGYQAEVLQLQLMQWSGWNDMRSSNAVSADGLKCRKLPEGVDSVV
jgi:hypothetical protein